MTLKEAKPIIDGMSYRQLLSRWRFAPTGDPMFIDKVGHYYAEVMEIKRIEIGDVEAAKTSKALGFNR